MRAIKYRKEAYRMRPINFTIRLSKSEYDYLKTQAEKLFMSVGAYIRHKAIVLPLEESEAQIQ